MNASPFVFPLKVFASSVTFLFVGIFALEASFDYATAFTCINCVRTQILIRTNFLPIQAYIPYFVPGIIALTLSGAFFGTRNYKLMAMSICVFLFETWVVFYSPFSPLWKAGSDPTTWLYQYLEERPAFFQTNSGGDVQAFYGFGIGMVFLLIYFLVSQKKPKLAILLTCFTGFTSLFIFEVGIFFILNDAWTAQVSLFQETILPTYISGLTNQTLFVISTIGLSISMIFLILNRTLTRMRLQVNKQPAAIP